MTRRNKATLALALATAGVLVSGVAQAALFDRGGGLIYDDVLKITWLSDANYAKTNNYDSDGRMNWTAANAWAAGLSYGGYEDWRLPTGLDKDGGACIGYNCTDSEMGHMFYSNLEASAGNSILTGTNTANLALFTNLQSYLYWSSTNGLFVDSAWGFDYGLGYQVRNYSTLNDFYAWAVRPGDVAAVPESEAYALLLAGLGLLGVVAKRRRRPFAVS